MTEDEDKITKLPIKFKSPPGEDEPMLKSSAMNPAFATTLGNSATGDKSMPLTLFARAKPKSNAAFAEPVSTPCSYCANWPKRKTGGRRQGSDIKMK